MKLSQLSFQDMLSSFMDIMGLTNTTPPMGRLRPEPSESRSIHELNNYLRGKHIHLHRRIHKTFRISFHPLRMRGKHTKIQLSQLRLALTNNEQGPTMCTCGGTKDSTI